MTSKNAAVARIELQCCYCWFLVWWLGCRWAETCAGSCAVLWFWPSCASSWIFFPNINLFPTDYLVTMLLVESYYFHFLTPACYELKSPLFLCFEGYKLYSLYFMRATCHPKCLKEAGFSVLITTFRWSPFPFQYLSTSLLNFILSTTYSG